MPSIETATKGVRLGAHALSDGAWEFLLWAPKIKSVDLHLLSTNRFVTMERQEHGYHHTVVPELAAGCRYMYRLNGERDLPDPASRFQPEGVHGPSETVDLRSFRWTDHNWNGRPLESSVFYELHVGTYTQQGTFDALIEHLPRLADLGITTIELMPVAQFSGGRNWGYDGVYPYAAQNTYGGPEALCRLIDSAHAHGLAVALDVVYNHLGPEGNYLNAYGPYFTDHYRTPWGDAINYDSGGSDEVRRFFIENALYWLEDLHFDALRLDAVHGIFDFGALHFLAELKSRVEELSARLSRPLHLIAESDLNDARLLHGPSAGGYGLDAQWSDDFHHAVHRLFTKEEMGYYADYEGMEPLATAVRQGWYYSGQYSKYRDRHHGSSPVRIALPRFVICNQNHDQIGNRAAGERLSAQIDFEAQKLAAGITLLSPETPLLFMGEEYGETAPFQYFTSHGDPELVEAVRRGRREEFAAFGWAESVPDPQDEETFSRSRLNLALKEQEPHQTLYKFYKELIRVRRAHSLGQPSEWTIRKLSDSALLSLREEESGDLAIIYNFSRDPLELKLPELAGRWTTLLCSADKLWRGPEEDFGSKMALDESSELHLTPQSFLAMKRERQSPEAA